MSAGFGVKASILQADMEMGEEGTSGSSVKRVNSLFQVTVSMQETFNLCRVTLS